MKCKRKIMVGIAFVAVVLFSNPYTNMNLKGLWGIQFPKIF